MMTKIGVFSIVSKNYISYARVLFNSIAKIHPEYVRYLCLADRVDGYFDAAAEPFKIVQADQLGIENFTDMSLRYDIMEFNTAVKPFVFEWLFAHTDLDVVIYLDPDICAYARFERLEAALESGASVVLTPHLTQPLEDGKTPGDYNMLQAGVFNLGFIAARRCQETSDFMAWWGRKLLSQCISDLKTNLFVDQKWCDLAPCFLENLKILRESNYNVAYWNLAQRHVTRSGAGTWLVDGQPLAFFHFSGVNAEKRRLVSKHQDRFGWDDIGVCQDLFQHYLDALLEQGWQTTRHWPYAYNAVSNNLPLNAILRQLYRSVVTQPADLRGVDLEKYLIELCNHSVADAVGDVRLTRLMQLVYQLRPDVQAVFNVNDREGRRQFAAWFAEAGLREYGLPPSVTGANAAPVSVQEEKKVVGFFYRMLVAFDAPARAMARLLPSGMRNHSKKAWTRLKVKVLQSF